MAGFNLRTIFQDIAAPSEEELAQQRQQEVTGIFGSPSQQVDVNVPDPTAMLSEPGTPLRQGASPFGLMNIEQQAQPGSQTGLFTDLPQSQVPMMQGIKNMALSSDPNVREQAYKMLGDFGGDGQPSATDYLDARISAYGAPVKMVDGVNVNKGKMQRALIGGDGEPDWKGTPYYPRNEYLNAPNAFVNPYAPGANVRKDLDLAEFRKKEGVANQKRMDEFNINIDKTEGALESTDFLLSELDNLANTATGWSTGWGSVMKDFPMTDANTWQTMKAGVLSNLGLDKLTQMKAETKTGASGMGQLNEAELELLLNFRGKLDGTNDPKVIKTIISKMQKLISNARKRMASRLENEKKWFDKKTERYGFDTVGTREMPTNLEAPERLPAGVSEGTTATNPKTGKRIVFRNGTWQ